MTMLISTQRRSAASFCSWLPAALFLAASYCISMSSERIPRTCREMVWENVSCSHLPLVEANTQQVYEDSTATVAKVRRMDGVQRALNPPAAGRLRPNSESGPCRKATPRGSHPVPGRPRPRWLRGVCKLFPVSSRNLPAVFADQHGPVHVSDHSRALTDSARLGRPLR